MRKFLLLALLGLVPPSTPIHKDRIEPPRTLSVGFKTGETATFAFSDSTIVGVSLRVGANDYAVPKIECDKLRDVRFETVSLLWNGSFEAASQANYFSLRFDMGTELTRAFGELPKVQLMFRDGKFFDAKVTKRIAANTTQDSEL